MTMKTYHCDTCERHVEIEPLPAGASDYDDADYHSALETHQDMDHCDDPRLHRVELGQPVQMYVNFYREDQEYGGPEEGGWWYRTGQFVVGVPVKGEYREFGGSVRPRVKADGAIARAREYIDENVWCADDDLTARVEAHPGRDYPTHRPHYE